MLLFDVNDFDETLPGPFEYDVKRMAASFAIAGRNNGFSKADARGDAGVGDGLPGGDGRLRSDADDGHLVPRLDEDELMKSIRQVVAGTAMSDKAAKKAEKKDAAARAPKKREKAARRREEAARMWEKVAKLAEKRAEKTAAKAHTRDSLQALSKLGEVVDGKYRIVSQPPIVVPARDLAFHLRPVPRQGPAGDPRTVPRLPGHPCRTTGAICWSGSRS